MSVQTGQRLASRIGVLPALLLAAAWWFPSGAYPLQSFGFCLAIAAFGLAAALLLPRLDADRRRRAAAPFASPAILAPAILALYAAARLQWTAVPALGRDWVVGLLWMATAAGAGALAMAALSRDAATAAAGLRRALTFVAVALGAYGIYQYAVGYPQALMALEATVSGRVGDLETQSLLHALRERRIGGRMGNPNLFAAQLAVLAVFCVGTAAERGPSRGLWRSLGVLAWLAAAAALMLTHSRGGVLTFAIATLLAAAAAWRGCCGRAARADIKGAAKTAAAILGTLSLVAFSRPAWAAVGWLDRIGRIDTIRERLFYWDIAWKVWLRNPLFGEGPGSFERLYPLLKSPLARESRYAHSWIFQCGAELGLIGLGLFFLLVGAVKWTAWRASRGNPNDNALREALWPLLAVLVLVFNGLFEFSLQWREFLIAAGMFAGIGAALATRDGPTNPFRAKISITALLLLLAASILAVMIGGRFDRAAAAHWEGRIALQNGAPREALAPMRRAVDLSPGNSQYLVELAGACSLTGNRSRALALLEEAQQANPDSASVRAAQARYWEQAGDDARALEKLNEALDRYPSKIQYQLERARFLLDRGRKTEARSALDAIELEQLPIWEYEREPYNALRARCGLPPVIFE